VLIIYSLGAGHFLWSKKENSSSAIKDTQQILNVAPKSHHRELLDFSLVLVAVLPLASLNKKISRGLGA